mgnify:CR=1 FL=1
MKPWRVLITRPTADSAVLAALLAEQQIYSSSLPLLEIQALPETPAQRSLLLNLDQYCAVIVVSKPAAILGIERVDQYWPQPLVDQHWFSVGAGTGRILQDYGLPTSWPDVGDDSEALLALPKFIETISTDDARVLVMLMWAVIFLPSNYSNAACRSNFYHCIAAAYRFILVIH